MLTNRADAGDAFTPRSHMRIDIDAGRSGVGVLFNNGPTQVGVMVGIVNAISQPFAQENLQSALGFTEWNGTLPLVIAAVVAFLLSIYQCRFIQPTTIWESIIVVPLVTGILFGMSLAANNLTASVMQSSDDNIESGVEPALVEKLTSFLEYSARLDQLLQELEAIPEETRISSIEIDRDSASPSGQRTRGIENLSLTTPTSAEVSPDMKRKRDQLRRLIAEQKKVREDINRLMKQMGDKGRKPQKNSKDTRGLYKPW